MWYHMIKFSCLTLTTLYDIMVLYYMVSYNILSVIYFVTVCPSLYIWYHMIYLSRFDLSKDFTITLLQWSESQSVRYVKFDGTSWGYLKFEVWGEVDANKKNQWGLRVRFEVKFLKIGQFFKYCMLIIKSIL